jgi:hypothetical protein
MTPDELLKSLRSAGGVQYTPDQDVKVHEEGAIRLICASFQTHENGLPEWVKNSADEYARTKRDATERIIVLILNDDRQRRTASISCLDFSGMTSDVIEQHFRQWADPDAAQRGAKADSIQGGHGNGGKCYMCQMFDSHALIQTVKDGLGCTYGVPANSVKFGYFPSRNDGRDYKVSNIPYSLRNALKDLHCDTSRLPPAVETAVAACSGYTLVSGFDPRGLSGHTAYTSLIDQFQEHTQMIRTLEFCHVYVMFNGMPFNGGKPLSLPNIPPLQGGETPRVIAIPETLNDPAYNKPVTTTDNGKRPLGQIVLLTSNKSMRWRRKGRHVITFKAGTDYIGYIPVPDLDVQSAFRDQIYGECCLAALEPFTQNDRGPLAEAPLTRAVKVFLSEQITKYAKEFEAKEKKKYDQKEKSELSKINEALDRWKNQFIDNLFGGQGKSNGNEPPTPQRLPSGKPARIHISLSHNQAGIGVSLKPAVEFFDANNNRIRPIPYRWVSDDTNTAMVDEDLGIINTYAAGTTNLYAETLDGKVRSNTTNLDVLVIRDIEIIPNKVELPVGSRRALETVCTLSNGEKTMGVFLVWTEDNAKIARVSAAGMVYGFEVGECQIAAGDDHAMAKSPAIISVIPATSGGNNEGKGRGYPIILLSSIDNDPDTNEPVHLSRDYPPVYQRPEDADRNIWWINSSSPIAGMLLDNEKGYGYHSREWRMYHLERYIEILIQIALTYRAKEQPNSSIGDYLYQWGTRATDIQAAAASSLVDFINEGTLPTA